MKENQGDNSVPSTAILLPQARTKGKGNRLCGLGEF